MALTDSASCLFRASSAPSHATPAPLGLCTPASPDGTPPDLRCSRALLVASLSCGRGGVGGGEARGRLSEAPGTEEEEGEEGLDLPTTSVQRSAYVFFLAAAALALAAANGEDFAFASCSNALPLVSLSNACTVGDCERTSAWRGRAGWSGITACSGGALTSVSARNSCAAAEVGFTSGWHCLARSR